MALSDENRQKILKTIFECGKSGIRVGDITLKLKLSRPAVSHHLKILKNANLISMRRVGTKNYYYLDACASVWSQIEDLASAFADVVRGGGAKPSALKG